MGATLVDELQRRGKGERRPLHVERTPFTARDLQVRAVVRERRREQVLGAGAAEVRERCGDVAVAQVDERVTAQDQVRQK